MFERPFWINRIEEAWRQVPIAWLCGVRRCGKTTLAESLGADRALYVNCDLPKFEEWPRKSTKGGRRRHNDPNGGGGHHASRPEAAPCGVHVGRYSQRWSAFRSDIRHHVLALSSSSSFGVNMSLWLIGAADRQNHAGTESCRVGAGSGWTAHPGAL